VGRNRNPIVGSGPVPTFGAKLRELVDAAPEKLTVRVLAARALCARQTVSAALSGTSLPSPQTLAGVVRACGGDEQEVEDWLKFLADTRRALDRLTIKALEFGPVLPTAGGASPGGGGRLGVITPDVADPADSEPRPESARTFAELRHQITLLRIAAGNPSYRTLAKAIPEATGRHYAASTVNDILTGRRAPGHELFEAIVTTLLARVLTDAPPSWISWREREPWLQAWRVAEYDRLRPDLTQPRYTGLYLVPEHQDHGPAPAVLAMMPPEQAAMLLAGLPPETAADVIGRLPARAQQKVMTAMARLTGPVTPTPPVITEGGASTRPTLAATAGGGGGIAGDGGSGDDGLGVDMTEPH
jgi:hypothetical protein